MRKERVKKKRKDKRPGGRIQEEGMEKENLLTDTRRVAQTNPAADDVSVTSIVTSARPRS